MSMGSATSFILSLSPEKTNREEWAEAKEPYSFSTKSIPPSTHCKFAAFLAIQQIFF